MIPRDRTARPSHTTEVPPWSVSALPVGDGYYAECGNIGAGAETLKVIAYDVLSGIERGAVQGEGSAAAPELKFRPTYWN